MRKSTEGEDRQVLSLDSQRSELDRLIQSEKLHIVDYLQESFSAKKPGRPVFNDMIRRIEGGEANGILIWNPNRLSRNSVDTGMTIYMLDEKKILEIRTPSQIFSNTPNDKFLLNLFCSQAKLENDNKGEDVKRGLRKKAEMGYRPGPARPGYLNTPDKEKGFRTIDVDPDRFNLVKKLFELILEQVYTPAQAFKIAQNEWRLTFPNGKLVSRSSFYRMLTDTFYYGEYEFPKGSGNWYKSSVEAIITPEQFDHIQIMLGRKGKPRPQKHTFAYTGLIRCGECGCMITAENTIKKQKNGIIRHYIHYHCTKKRGPCSQKYIQVGVLEDQMYGLLSKIEIPQPFVDWALDILKEENRKESSNRNVIISSLQKDYTTQVKKIDSLVDMRARELINDEQYRKAQQETEKERRRVHELLNDADSRVNTWANLATDLFTFAERARRTFTNESIEGKRSILSYLGSNLTLKDQKLSIDLQKPLSLLEPVFQKGNELWESARTPDNLSIKRKNRVFDPACSILLRSWDSNPEPLR